MNNTLAWLCYAGAASALLFYFVVWARRPSAVRLLNNAGLCSPVWGWDCFRWPSSGASRATSATCC